MVPTLTNPISFRPHGGVFSKAPAAMPKNWGCTFAASFKKRKGYDLIPKLKSLWEGESAADMKVRQDYHACRAELQEEAFFKPMFRWHEKHGLQSGFDQQGDARSGNPVDC